MVLTKRTLTVALLCVTMLVLADAQSVDADDAATLAARTFKLGGKETLKANAGGAKANESDSVSFDVVLRDDGTFTADEAAGRMYSGTYTLKGKKVVLTLDTASNAVVEGYIEEVLSAVAGQAVDVTLTKPPVLAKGKVGPTTSVKVKRVKFTLRFVADPSITGKGTYKAKMKGPETT